MGPMSATLAAAFKRAPGALAPGQVGGGNHLAVPLSNTAALYR